MSNTESHKEKAAARLKEIRTQLDQAKAKAASLSGDASDAARASVDALEKKYAAAKHKFDELGDASEEVWQKASKELESAWEGVKSGVKKLFG